MKRNSVIKWQEKEHEEYVYEVINMESNRAITVNIAELYGIEDFANCNGFQKSVIRNGLVQKLRDAYALPKGSTNAEKWEAFTSMLDQLSDGVWNKPSSGKGMSKVDRFREAITPLKAVLSKEQVREAFSMHPGFSEAVLDEVFGE